jgi:hypothetical protein
MKTAKLIIGQALSLFIVLSAVAQGTFQNLDFEQATPAQFSGTVSAADALPYWTPEIGGVPQTEILQNGLSTGDPEVVLLTPRSPQPPLDGDYSVLLTGSFDSASISQTGEIPFGTQSLFFDAKSLASGNLSVQIGNQSVSFTPVAVGPNFTEYGASVSAWAGQTESLTFSAEMAGGLNNWEIDDISFSTSVVPEPGPIALTAIGGLLFALYRRFAPKHR